MVWWLPTIIKVKLVNWWLYHHWNSWHLYFDRNVFSPRWQFWQFYNYTDWYDVSIIMMRHSHYYHHGKGWHLYFDQKVEWSTDPSLWFIEPLLTSRLQHIFSPVGNLPFFSFLFDHIFSFDHDNVTKLWQLSMFCHNFSFWLVLHFSTPNEASSSLLHFAPHLAFFVPILGARLQTD